MVWWRSYGLVNLSYAFPKSDSVHAFWTQEEIITSFTLSILPRSFGQTGLPLLQITEKYTHFSLKHNIYISNDENLPRTFCGLSCNVKQRNYALLIQYKSLIVPKRFWHSANAFRAYPRVEIKDFIPSNQPSYIKSIALSKLLPSNETG